MLVESYSIREESSGAGRQRGGLGAEMVVQALSPFSVTTRIDRVHCKPWGIEGGGEAAGNGIAIRRKGEWDTGMPNAKIFNVRLARGVPGQPRRRAGCGACGQTCRASMCPWRVVVPAARAV